MKEQPLLYVGEAKRPRGRPLAIREPDRHLGMLILGKTGVGKSSLLEGMARQDIAAGRGCAVIDPHGDLAEALVRAARRAGSSVLYLNPGDPASALGFNPLRQVPDAQIARAAATLLGVFEKQWPSAWGVRMEHVLRNSFYALLARPASALLDVLRLYRDDAFRASVVATVRNDVVRAFWEHEFEPLSQRQRSELVAPIENKLGALLTDPVVLRTLVAPEVDLDLRDVMDNGQTLIVNFARGRIGADSATLLGSVLVSLIGETAFARTDAPVATRRPFYLYVDEFQTFTTRAFAAMVSELRKTGVAPILATQHLAGVSPEVRQAVVGNVGTVIAFRVGPDDAASFAREFGPRIGAIDLMRLPNREFYVRLMVDGEPTIAVSGRSIEQSCNA